MKKSNLPFLTRTTMSTTMYCIIFILSIYNNTFSQQILFSSSNNSGMVGITNVSDNNNITTNMFSSNDMDADGIFYVAATDKLYQIDRTNNVVIEYSNAVMATNNGMTPTVTATSSSDFINGREIAVFGNKIIVAQDANSANNDMNKLIVYNIGTDEITLDKIFDVDINLWGIHLDGNRLFAIQDNSNNLAVYMDIFSNPNGSISPSKIISVENLVRTHGLTYDPNSDLMILTDIGAASSADDGALICISDFMSVANDDMISTAEQIRIGGSNSNLGNPVDVAYNPNDNMIYVAERAKNGGMILGFQKSNTSGDFAPTYSQMFAGASAVNLSNQLQVEGQFFVSSNNSGMVGVVANGMVDIFPSEAMDADGVFYNEEKDVLYQLNRTDDVINIYANVSSAIANGTTPTLVATSTSDFANGREIAVSGNKLIVADDASADNNSTNRVVVYTLGDNNTITLDKKHEVNFALWGIHLDGSTLYAIQDVSPNVAIFNNFFNNPAGLANPDQVVFIENLVRTHGLTYDNAQDLMILTDIGAASSADDGALIIIPNFNSKTNDNAIDMSEQVRVGGATSMLGNPVDVAYDSDSDKIFVAERAVNGGMILGFEHPMASGNATPIYTQNFMGASAIYFPTTIVGPCSGIEGGLVELEMGGTETTIIIDGNPDLISFNTSVASSSDYSFTYVVTDANGNILGIPSGNAVDFDPAGTGACLVYGLTYTGNLNIQMGDNLLQNGLMISSDCFDLSDNFLTINRITSQAPNTQLFVSSNNSGMIGVIEGSGMNMFNSQGIDADGIFYDKTNDVLYQLNRTDDVVNIYTGINDALANGTDPVLVATSTSDFANGREIAVSGNMLIVADDASADNNFTNRLVVYTLGINNTITFEKSHEVNFALWGIHLEDSTLFAIQDVSPNVAIFENFFNNPAGMVIEDKVVFIENLVRTHGLTYSANEDLLILTDIGAASSADDGALIVISNFNSKIADMAIDMSEQIRIGGNYTMLGNPVDVAYDSDSEVIYIAERAKNGGMILGFDFPNTSGNIAPSYAKDFMGASAINIPATINDVMIGEIFASSNTMATVGVVNLFESGNTALTSFDNQGMDADGIYYDEETDMIYQLNRSANVIDVYTSVKTNLMAGNDPEYMMSSTSDFINGREIAIVGDTKLVVAQDANTANNDMNKLVVYDIAGGNITLSASVDVSINLWGIEANGDDLIAIIDNSNQVAIFEDFANTNASIPTSIISVENLVRTHGLTYHASSDLMILTDIGAASSADDGALVAIENFTTASSDMMITVDEQIRMGGSNTQLGNPVDVEYDEANGLVYVAERANGGGKILAFDNASGDGNVFPVLSIPFSGVSALYLNTMTSSSNDLAEDNDDFKIDNNIITASPSIEISNLYPVPAEVEITIMIDAMNDLETELNIYNTSGMIVKSKALQIFQGENKTQLNVQDLPSGIFFIEISGMNKTYKFVKSER